MERFYQFWAKHYPHLPDGPRQFIDSHHSVVAYAKGQVIKLPDSGFPYYCVVLAGLVGGYQKDLANDPALRELVLPMHFFTGTDHPFTLRSKDTEYRALEKTTLLQLPIAAAQAGQLRYSEVAEIFHVMKQYKINLLRKLVAIYQEPEHYARYCVYRALLPELALQLPHTVQEQLLRMSHASYQRVKAQYLR